MRYDFHAFLDFESAGGGNLGSSVFDYFNDANPACPYRSKATHMTEMRNAYTIIKRRIQN